MNNNNKKIEVSLILIEKVFKFKYFEIPEKMPIS